MTVPAIELHNDLEETLNLIRKVALLLPDLRPNGRNKGLLQIFGGGPAAQRKGNISCHFYYVYIIL